MRYGLSEEVFEPLRKLFESRIRALEPMNEDKEKEVARSRCE